MRHAASSPALGEAHITRSTRCLHRAHPMSRHPAAAAPVARASRASGRKAKLKEFSDG
jgi:hypothetical protein